MSQIAKCPLEDRCRNTTIRHKKDAGNTILKQYQNKTSGKSEGGGANRQIYKHMDIATHGLNQQTGKLNKELFENAPPYMIIRPSLKGCLYMSAGHTSK